jgi:hypothetical protein
MTDSIKQTADQMMRAIVRSGCLDGFSPDQLDRAVGIMREELKAMVDTTNPKYADERAVALTGNSGLAMASMVAECIERIINEIRKPAQAAG